MALYQVRDGATLGHHGRVLTAGDTLDLPDAVAADGAIAPHITAYTAPPVVVDVPPAPVETVAVPRLALPRGKTLDVVEGEA